MTHDVQITLRPEVGMPVSLFDSDMRQISGWVDLAEGTTDEGLACFVAEFPPPDQPGEVLYSMLWDRRTGLLQPRKMDMPIRVTPESVPIRLYLTRSPTFAEAMTELFWGKPPRAGAGG